MVIVVGLVEYFQKKTSLHFITLSLNSYSAERAQAAMMAKISAMSISTIRSIHSLAA
jgi:hypothetical protein